MRSERTQIYEKKIVTQINHSNNQNLRIECSVDSIVMYFLQDDVNSIIEKKYCISMMFLPPKLKQMKKLNGI